LHIEEGTPAVLGEQGSENLHYAQYTEDIGVELRAGGFTGLRIEQTTPIPALLMTRVTRHNTRSLSPSFQHANDFTMLQAST
jgi:hypothetical protein